jgi:hypothetical protein
MVFRVKAQDDVQGLGSRLCLDVDIKMVFRVKAQDDVELYALDPNL